VWDVAGAKKALLAKPEGAAASELADKLRKWFGDAIKHGGAAKSEGLDAIWALEAPDAKGVSVTGIDGPYRMKLQQLPGTGVWAGVDSLSDGFAFRYAYDVDGRKLGVGQMETYAILPDSLPQAGVPRGKVLPQPRWKSKIFDGTERDFWIYVPAQYKPSQPAAVMVFQDGGGYVKQVPTVFDNLIHRGDMPVTVGVFLNPGTFAEGRSNRSFEYDTLSDQYARFILDEILPAVEKVAKLRKDPESRAIAGISSGGICAFTVAWERPEAFRKVLSWVGSFTDIAAGSSRREGGHNYPALIRKIPRKPLRIFLQDGDNDLDNEHGSWPLANRGMEHSLAWAGYDFKLVWGHGFHGNKHGFAILPESLRWLWRDWKTTSK
jgi:enterochelin esterase family protein